MKPLIRLSKLTSMIKLAILVVLTGGAALVVMAFFKKDKNK